MQDQIKARFTMISFFFSLPHYQATLKAYSTHNYDTFSNFVTYRDIIPEYKPHSQVSSVMSSKSI